MLGNKNIQAAALFSALVFGTETESVKAAHVVDLSLGAVSFGEPRLEKRVGPGSDAEKAKAVKEVLGAFKKLVGAVKEAHASIPAKKRIGEASNSSVEEVLEGLTQELNGHFDTLLKDGDSEKGFAKVGGVLTKIQSYIKELSLYANFEMIKQQMENKLEHDADLTNPGIQAFQKSLKSSLLVADGLNQKGEVHELSKLIRTMLEDARSAGHAAEAAALKNNVQAAEVGRLDMRKTVAAYASIFTGLFASGVMYWSRRKD